MIDPANLPGKRILLVDDSKSARFSLKRLLQQQDIKTEFAESAGDALNYLTDNSPDIIFMDHLMPGMDGFEATKAIKSNPETKDIPVIMCTSKDGNDYAQQAMAIGAYAILPKPAPAATLAAILKRLDPAAGQTPTQDSAGQENKSPAAAPMTPRTVENLARKVMDERFGMAQKSLSESLSKSLMNTLKQEITQEVKQVQQSLKQELHSIIDSKVRSESTAISQKLSDELISSHMEELKKQLENRLNKSMSELESRLDAARKSDTDILSEVQTLARSTAEDLAVEAAQNCSAEISEQVAQDVVAREINQHASTITEQLTRQLEEKTKSGKLLGLAGLLMGLAAIVITLING